MHEAAVLVLRENGCSGVMYGDAALLDEIAARAGSVPRKRTEHPLSRWKRVLDALSRSPGPLVQRRSRCGGGGRGERWVRSFFLPEAL